MMMPIRLGSQRRLIIGEFIPTGQCGKPKFQVNYPALTILITRAHGILNYSVMSPRNFFIFMIEITTMDQCWRDLIAVLGAQALNIDLNELITDRENSVIGGKLCGKWPRASKGLYRETARVFILYLNEVLADLDEILKSEHKHIIDIAYLLGAALAGGAKAVEFTKVSGGLAMKLLNGAQYALAVVRPDEAPRLLSSLKPPLMRRSPDVFARLLLMAVLANMHRVDVISKLWPLIHGLSNMRQSLSDWG